ncbi:ABC-type glycerol-3-phosphate transport system, substrate-binding protein [Amphibacillus marinus]|uniref:ABC-type glycerol-3-phosphate transport system, substrate-binding protein n=1 Tax=Amphibacillus marinus TaxID=872970 RepID=A0A1H8ISR9_9BACI|nr:extracellular solute-binding protein [Amphibacillus marinus]SEN70698.1 ABC-type glycerol-3-phosphate transport system, substrate-binding protein [Amphibacillus marinus]
MKRLWLLSCVLGLMLFLVACGNDSSDPASDDEVDNGSETVEDPEPAEEELPDHDFGGLVLKVGAPFSREIDPNVNERNERLAERIAFLEEKWNFTYETVEIGWDDWVGNYIRSTLGGDPIADIVHVLSPALYPNLISNGIVYPVSDLGVIDYDDIKWSQAAKDASEYEGKYYSLTPNGIDMRDAIFWNKTLFDDLGLPDLYELYENGEWTWEKMMEIADQATRDTDNDGETDIFGFAAENLAWKLIYANGYESITKTDDGIEIDMNDETVVEALEFFSDVNNSFGHTLREPEEGDEWNFRYTDFADGNIAMVSAEWWVTYNYWTDGRMQGEYGMVPFPTGPSFDQSISYGYEQSYDVMLATVDQPEEKAIIWDAIHDIGTDDDWERWIRADFEAHAGDRETVDYGLMLNNNTRINLIRGFEDINNTFNDFFAQVSSGETTVQSGLESIESQIQAALEDFENEGMDLGIDEEEE